MPVPAAEPVETRRHAPVFHELRVGSIERLTDDAYAVTLDVPEYLREEFHYAAGQHVNIRFGQDDVRRSYSICAPAGSGVLRIGVKHLPGGAFSSYVANGLCPGDPLDVMTPTGRFTPHLDSGRALHYALVAAGSGITPLLSIAATVLETEPRSTVTLLYGNRTSRSVMFVEDLYDLKNSYPDRFALVHAFSREQQRVPLFSGRLDRDRFDRILRALCPSESVDQWFLCGPWPMVTELHGYLRERGHDQVHVELFHADPPPRRPAPSNADAGDRATVTAMLDGRTTTFELAENDVAVLDGLLGERADAPYACKGGVCGTCRALLVEGDVRMDQCYALDDADLKRGFILTCQSHPTTQTVRVDYDA